MTHNPNHVHLNAGVISDHTFGAGFGPLVSCHPVHFAGVGHLPHIEAKFQHGIRLDLDRATAIEFARALTESVNALPPTVDFSGGDCAGIAAELGDA